MTWQSGAAIAAHAAATTREQYVAQQINLALNELEAVLTRNRPGLLQSLRHLKLGGVDRGVLMGIYNRNQRAAIEACADRLTYWENRA